ncbi:MAG: N-acetyl-gamma-glutamyl-phosphate reductase [Oligoflexia bacterium]|nr:N-acetyl-gamma-glutamyl-phosphate reductase [Oligoflexia bacterium]
MKASSSIKVAVVGGSGYVGLELLRLLASHPEVRLTAVTSRQYAGKPIGEVHPALSRLVDLSFSGLERIPADTDLIFVAVPHTEAMGLIADLYKSTEAKFVDLSSDFRLSPDQFARIYAKPHAAPELCAAAVYGVPELRREAIRSARLVANPGCFANCISLGLLPLAKAGRISDTVKVTAITGSSGSGITPTAKTHHPERTESMSAYSVLEHRHVPEIEATLAAASGERLKLELVPVSGPFSRGIFASSFVQLRSEESILPLYAAFAEENRFIRIRQTSPRVVDVRGSNFCDIAIKQIGSTAVVLSSLDNLVKGASGNAVQCMNLMCGLDESCGLNLAPLCP